MKRYLPVFLVAILLVVAIAAAVWSMRPREPITVAALADFDYAAPESWAVRPASPPPAVWESGWDIDVLLLSADAAIEPGEIETEEHRLQAASKSLDALSAAFNDIGPVYAPLLRRESLGADAAAALARYIEEDNRGRAFVVATDTILPATFVETLGADKLLRDRFAGVMAFGETPDAAGFAQGTNTQSVCSRRYDETGACTQVIELRRSGSIYIVAGENEPGNSLVGGFTVWLHGNASKLAEPLGDLEEIEIVEIQKAPEGN